jgi:hypothetical protein
MLPQPRFQALRPTLFGSAAALALLGGCHGSDQLTDGGSSRDLTSPTVDLRTGGDPSDGGAVDLVGHVYSCAGSDAPGSRSQQATSALILPKSSGTATYSFDLDGDGRTENQLKTVVQALSLTGADLQGTIDAQVAAGGLVYLLGITSSSLDSSSCTGISLRLAKPRSGADPLPRYDGSDVFTKGPGVDTELFGKIVAGRLSSIPPAALTSSQESRFTLSLSVMGTTLSLPVRGAYLDGTLSSTGGQLTVRNGSLHGAVAKSDIDGILLPGIAKAITRLINGDPTSSTTGTMIALFEDLGKSVSATKCTVARDCCHTSPATCRILPEEVAASAIGGVLAPDVQVFNASDEWAPVPGGRNKNGMSIGVGFSSVAATF